jgi:hypothetical protein
MPEKKIMLLMKLVVGTKNRSENSMRRGFVVIVASGIKDVGSNPARKMVFFYTYLSTRFV